MYIPPLRDTIVEKTFFWGKNFSPLSRLEGMAPGYVLDNSVRSMIVPQFRFLPFCWEQTYFNSIQKIFPSPLNLPKTKRGSSGTRYFQCWFEGIVEQSTNFLTPSLSLSSPPPTLHPLFQNIMVFPRFTSPRKITFSNYEILFAAFKDRRKNSLIAVVYIKSHLCQKI